ncbi:MAG: hypothetical protein AAB551_04160 [Patescibacteria group bacterium]
MALNKGYFAAAGAALTLGAQSQDAQALTGPEMDQKGVTTIYEIGKSLFDDFVTEGVRTQIKNNKVIGTVSKNLPFAGETPKVGMICGYRIMLTSGVEDFAEGCLIVLDKDGTEVMKLTPADHPFIGQVGGLQVEDGGAGKNGLAAMMGLGGVQFFTFNKSATDPLQHTKTVSLPLEKGEGAFHTGLMNGSYYMATSKPRIVKADSATGNSSAYDIPEEFYGGQLITLPNFPGIPGGAIGLATSKSTNDNRIDVFNPNNFSESIFTAPTEDGVSSGNSVGVDPSGQYLVAAGFGNIKIFDTKDPTKKTKVLGSIAGAFKFGKNEAGQITITLKSGTVTITNGDPLAATFKELEGEIDGFGGTVIFVKDTDGDGYDDEVDPDTNNPNIPEGQIIPPSPDAGGKDNDAGGATDTDTGGSQAEAELPTPPVESGSGSDAANGEVSGAEIDLNTELKKEPTVEGNLGNSGQPGSDVGPSIQSNNGSAGCATGSSQEAPIGGLIALGVAAGAAALARRRFGKEVDDTRAEITSI